MTVPVLLVALALGTDAFSVAAALAPRALSFRQHFRLVWHFAWFQFMMTFLGALSGEGLSAFVQSVASYVSCALLALVSAHMLLSAFKSRPSDTPRPDATRGLSLVVLSVATSLDAFAVGVTYGLSGSAILVPSILIGGVAGLMTFAGLFLGRRIHARIDARPEILGAVILAVLAVKQLL
ncbi:MAG: manganese efflux pump MntP family protein [Planctomycetota bacterium]